MINEDDFYVVYNKNINVIDDPERGNLIILPEGYHMAAYPMADDEIKYIGSYHNCKCVLVGLLSFVMN